MLANIAVHIVAPMATDVKAIEKEALRLPPKARKVLADKLMNSLDDAPLTDVDEAWLVEAEKRYKSYREGKSKGIPAARLFAEIRRELGWQR